MKTNQGTKQSAIQSAAKACVTSYQRLAEEFERTKLEILAEFQKTLTVPETLFRLALNEAEALAWQTLYPQLVFPDLAMEKIRDASHWNERQRLLR